MQLSHHFGKINDKEKNWLGFIKEVIELGVEFDKFTSILLAENSEESYGLAIEISEIDCDGLEGGEYCVWHSDYTNHLINDIESNVKTINLTISGYGKQESYKVSQKNSQESKQLFKDEFSAFLLSNEYKINKDSFIMEVVKPSDKYETWFNKHKLDIENLLTDTDFKLNVIFKPSY